MSFLPAPPGCNPAYDSNTDEIVIEVEGAANVPYVVPPQCCYMTFAISDTSSGMGSTPGVFLTPDNADRDSGIWIDNSSGGHRHFGCAFAPGTTFYMHTSAALGESVDVNITRYYRKP
jgi:hypothetical protein